MRRERRLAPALDPDGPKPWWNGPAGKGAMSKLREFKRLTAEDRNKLTLPEDRSTKRQKATGGAP